MRQRKRPTYPSIHGSGWRPGETIPYEEWLRQAGLDHNQDEVWRFHETFHRSNQRDEALHPHDLGGEA